MKITSGSIKGDDLTSERKIIMSYRLYNEDVAEGLVDFNDQEYHILKINGDYTLIFNDCTDQFIVAYKLQYHDLESIDWAQGHYFSDVVEATRFLEDQTIPIKSFLHTDEQLSTEALDLIWNTMTEARDQGNIPSTDLEGMLDLTISFILDNEDIFDAKLVEEIRDIYE